MGDVEQVKESKTEEGKKEEKLENAAVHLLATSACHM